MTHFDDHFRYSLLLISLYNIIDLIFEISFTTQVSQVGIKKRHIILLASRMKLVTMVIFENSNDAPRKGLVCYTSSLTTLIVNFIYFFHFNGFLIFCVPHLGLQVLLYKAVWLATCSLCVPSSYRLVFAVIV